MDFFEINAGVLQGHTLALIYLLLHWTMTLERPPKMHQPVLCWRKDGVLENLRCRSLMQTFQRISHWFQTTWNKPNYFYQDWKWQQKLLGCMQTAKSICYEVYVIQPGWDRSKHIEWWFIEKGAWFQTSCFVDCR